jgi:phosphoribosylamine--glycine ligase
MNVLVIGGGAREHAICEAVCQSPSPVTLFSVMHNINPGIQKLSSNMLREKEIEVSSIADYAKRHHIDLAIVGPEAPLEAGLVNALQKGNISVCSPTKEAAKVETDKLWMRQLLRKHGIPGQLRCESFTGVKKARGFIEELNGEVAIKPIGLTGGKGVRVAGDHFKGVDEAVTYVREILEKKIGGQSRVLIEEKAVGEEFTLQAFSDGSSILPLPAVQDHKRLLPDDKGPNTGGMGSYSCPDGFLPFLTQGEYEESAGILQRVIEALSMENCRYIGPVYGQFMLTAEGPKIIEINARFGDPEAMNVLSLLRSNFVDLCMAMVEGNLTQRKLLMQKRATVCKYVVPEGYGVQSRAGEKIVVNEAKLRETGSRLFYAAVNKADDHVLTTSSRSLAVVGIAEDLSTAEIGCEDALKYVQSDHIFIRHDIGTEELVEQRVNHMKQLRGM